MDAHDKFNSDRATNRASMKTGYAMISLGYESTGGTLRRKILKQVFLNTFYCDIHDHYTKFVLTALQNHSFQRTPLLASTCYIDPGKGGSYSTVTITAGPAAVLSLDIQIQSCCDCLCPLLNSGRFSQAEVAGEIGGCQRIQSERRELPFLPLWWMFPHNLEISMDADS